ncbi:AbrB/MazE/SpoVT family DNA-binding domain-containing protein [Mesorhizobium sp. 8]|uniref:AbrB/MazE/SpoVT family DNA-binding domain-containing protein n=1 Tax=Mesorhizobium sp. 8 TaxID=2584466 RepID=UPI00111E6C06|nr:AbrB/MazE/SpoVT family DNA-binding domain-containing protein [Mesorhizobium sp. 8]QDC01084.1 AbrB/MazE/SpoVT family DNA-binding domain-containing protein [Mesorhizobium sp. 8]
MRVTEKGQVTIPKNVRRKLGIVAGSEIEFDLREDGALLRHAAAPRPGREVADFMDHIRRHKGTMDLGGMTGDEFFKLLRD